MMMTSSSFKGVNALGVRSRNIIGKKSIILSEIGAKNEKYAAR